MNRKSNQTERLIQKVSLFFSSRMGRYTGIDMYFGIDFLLRDDDNYRKIRKFVC